MGSTEPQHTYCYKVPFGSLSAAQCNKLTHLYLCETVSISEKGVAEIVSVCTTYLRDENPTNKLYAIDAVIDLARCKHAGVSAIPAHIWPPVVDRLVACMQDRGLAASAQCDAVRAICAMACSSQAAVWTACAQALPGVLSDIMVHSSTSEDGETNFAGILSCRAFEVARGVALSPHAEVGAALATVLPTILGAWVARLQRDRPIWRIEDVGTLAAIANSTHAEVGAALASSLPGLLAGLVSCVRTGACASMPAWSLGSLASCRHAAVGNVYAAALPSMVSSLLCTSSDLASMKEPVRALEYMCENPSPVVYAVLTDLLPAEIAGLAACLHASSQPALIPAAQEGARVQRIDQAALVLQMFCFCRHAVAQAALASVLPDVIAAFLACLLAEHDCPSSAYSGPREEQAQARQYSALGLGSLAGRSVLPASTHAGVVTACESALPCILHALLARLQDHNAAVRSEAARALAKIASSPHAQITGKFANALPEVSAALDCNTLDDNPGVARDALQALGDIAASSSPEVATVYSDMVPRLLDRVAVFMRNDTRLDPRNVLCSIAHSSHVAIGTALAAALPRILDSAAVLLQGNDFSAWCSGVACASCIPDSPHAAVHAACVRAAPSVLDGVLRCTRAQGGSLAYYAIQALLKFACMPHPEVGAALADALVRDTPTWQACLVDNDKEVRAHAFAATWLLQAEDTEYCPPPTVRAVLVSHIRQLMPQLTDCLKLDTGKHARSNFRRVCGLIAAIRSTDPALAGSLVSMVASAWLATVRSAASNDAQSSNAAQNTSELDRVAHCSWGDVMTALALGVHSTDPATLKTVAQLGVWVLRDWGLCGEFTTAYARWHGDGGDAWHALEALVSEYQDELE